MIQCPKMDYFYRTEAGLTAKWGRISPAVQWCYQNQSNCTTTYYVERRHFKICYQRDTHTHMQVQGHTQACTERII